MLQYIKVSKLWASCCVSSLGVQTYLSICLSIPFTYQSIHPQIYLLSVHQTNLHISVWICMYTQPSWTQATGTFRKSNPCRRMHSFCSFYGKLPLARLGLLEFYNVNVLAGWNCSGLHVLSSFSLVILMFRVYMCAYFSSDVPSISQYPLEFWTFTRIVGNRNTSMRYMPLLYRHSNFWDLGSFDQLLAITQKYPKLGVDVCTCNVHVCALPSITLY